MRPPGLACRGYYLPERSAAAMFGGTKVRFAYDKAGANQRRLGAAGAGNLAHPLRALRRLSAMTLDLTFGGRLRIPLIAAPMFLVSSPEMALAACSQAVMGSFPTHSTRTRAVFAGWLDQMTRGMQELRD